MEEASKVRLVLCPKCENLLPELPGYSVYQCGGCGAVLRGMSKGSEIDGFLEKSEDESGRKDYEKGGVGLASASEAEREHDNIDQSRGKERAFPEKRNNLVNSFSSRTKNREVLTDFESSSRGDTAGSSSDQRSGVEFFDNKSGRQSRVLTGRDEFVSMGVESENEKFRRRFGPVGSWPVMDQLSAERNGPAAFHGNGRGVAEQKRFATFSYPDEGTSIDPFRYFYGYGEQVKNRDDLDGLAKVESLENDRSELLRKLDELKDQLSRSYNSAEQPNGRIGPDKGVARPLPDLYCQQEASIPESSSSLYNVNMHPSAGDKHVPKTPYLDQNHRPFPYGQTYALDMQDLYAPRPIPNEFMQYDDAYRPQMLRRPPYQSVRQYFPWTYHDHFSGHETFFHQPACSCYHCYNKNWQVSLRAPPFSGQRSPNDPAYRIYYQHENPVTYGPPDYNTTGSVPLPLHSQGRQPHSRSSSDLDSENAGFGQRRLRRIVVGHGSGQVCRPIAGGAPFIACCNCFELLKLPRKVLLVGKKQQKIRCGACFTIVLFELDDKGLVISVPLQVKEGSEVAGGSAGIVDRNFKSYDSHLNAGPTISCPDDSSGYNSQLTQKESNVLSKDQKRQDSRLSSSSSLEDEQSPDSVIVQRAVSSSPELPIIHNGFDPLSDSPPEGNPDNTSHNTVSSDGKGNKSKWNYLEKLIMSRNTSRQNSVKDVAVATEMEVSFNEYLNSGVSQDSVVEVNRDDQSRTNKRNESFFAGLIKKGFRDFSRSSQNVENGRSNVFVNGQLLPDRVVKKAEKLVGTIQPGEYWYDFQAGFWGVMGQPCLGIIPPQIEEFNYRMPEGCAAGNTGVFVNGRELHQRDLDLLSARGLPVTKDKSYIIEISGKVMDKDTGEELDNLGKLAPTVERVKHGFGMKIPRVLAQ